MDDLPNSNLTKWRHYLKDVISPNSYINMGFYSMIASCLQRRVWYGSTSGIYQIFPNMYVILVGDPGIGKTLVLKAVNELVRYWKIPDMLAKLKEEHSKSMKQYEDEATLLGQTGNLPSKNQEEDERYVIPVAADSTTYRSLTKEMAKSVRRIDFKVPSEIAPFGIYTHSSLCFLLEEVSSLFDRNSEDVVRFLLNAYDCGDYKRSTATQGVDRIRKCCLNMLAGTTPGFMQDSFDNKLLSEGYASRSIFVFESQNRFNKFGISHPTLEQLKSRDDILKHIKALTELKGPVTFAPEAWEYLRKYFEEEFPLKRENYNLKLVPYYARKNIHAIKMAINIHFADKLDMVITLDDCILALAMLAALEKRMHFALQYRGANMLSAVSKKVVKYIAHSGPKTFKELWLELEMEAREQELHEVIRFLYATGQIRELKEDNVIRYDVVNKESN